MGKVKELAMEQEYYSDWLCNIIDKISNTNQFKVDLYLQHCVRVLKRCIPLFENGSLQFEAVSYLNTEKQNIEDIVAKICLGDKSKDLSSVMSRKAAILASKLHNRDKQLNSESFYKEKVDALETDKQRLIQELDNLSNQHGKEHEKTQTQISSLHSEIENKEKALLEARKQYEKAKSQVEAQNNVNNRITLSFMFLSKQSEIIMSEKKRLNVLYYAYMVISVIVLLCFFIIVGLLWYNMLQMEDINWLGYLKFYLPVPLCSGLLWFSVYQMNRAHRMLLNIVNQLHTIKYVEGLLLAVNNLSLDANEGIHKVQDVLDQIVKKYLNHLDFLSESAIDDAISKDKLNIDTDKIVSLLTGIRNILDKR